MIYLRRIFMKKIALFLLTFAFILPLVSCGATNVDELLNLDILTQWPYKVTESRDSLQSILDSADEDSDEYKQAAEKIDMLDYLEKYNADGSPEYLELWDTVDLPVASKYVTSVIPYATKSGKKNSISITMNDITEKEIVAYINKLIELGYGSEEDFYNGEFKIMFNATLYQRINNDKGSDVTKTILSQYGEDINGKKVLRYTSALYETLTAEGYVPAASNDNRYLYIVFDKQGNLQEKCLLIYTNTTIEQE